MAISVISRFSARVSLQEQFRSELLLVRVVQIKDVITTGPTTDFCQFCQITFSAVRLSRGPVCGDEIPRSILAKRRSNAFNKMPPRLMGPQPSFIQSGKSRDSTCISLSFALQAYPYAIHSGMEGQASVLFHNEKLWCKWMMGRLARGCNA